MVPSPTLFSLSFFFLPQHFLEGDGFFQRIFCTHAMHANNNTTADPSFQIDVENKVKRKNNNPTHEASKTIDNLVKTHTKQHDILHFRAESSGRHGTIQNVPHKTRGRRPRAKSHRGVLSQGQILEQHEGRARKRRQRHRGRFQLGGGGSGGIQDL